MMTRICAPLVAALALFAMSGCGSMPSYVDPALGDVTPDDRVQVVEKRPVQLAVSFQTNGTPNPIATGHHAKRATELVAASGLFSEVSPSPVPGGARLSIVVNNVPEENALVQGFLAGLTFGMTDSTASDAYVATATYAASATAAATTVEKKHAIHSPMDATFAPEGVKLYKSMDDTFDAMMRQLLDHVLNEVAKDPSFRPASPELRAAAR